MKEGRFTLESKYQPAGDQPAAISALVKGINGGMERQTLLGATGTGKTFTMANVIMQQQKPTLIIAHNKTLAAQLASEFKEFFPNNAVHYFVSYYDYYQPEAYMPTTDTYIEKDAQINKEIDRLRHATTQSLLTRNDVIIVASVSCIYGLGSPKEYERVNLRLEKGTTMNRTQLMERLVAIHFTRTNADLNPGQFRALGNRVEIMPVSETVIYAVEFGITKAGPGIVSILKIDPVSSRIIQEEETVFVFPAKHFITDADEKERAVNAIKLELDEQLATFEKEGKLLEAERLKRRTTYDLAMIREMGYCSGIENYSRHMSGKKAGEPPETLLSYFPHKEDGTPEFLLFVDESHVTLPQLQGMYAADASRKQTLVEFGFRLPSAKDNRPLTAAEFNERVGQAIYVSATPSVYEREHSQQIVEQIIRPTGLIDPEVTVRPILENGDYKGQVHNFIAEAEAEIKKGGRVLATTLTKRMAEDLTEYLKERGVRATYVHSDVLTIERIKIISSFRKGEYDMLVGVNLLREGLDMPEVSLIGILDADKEGFLRSEVSLIQTIGRAARNVNGRVILYADRMTGSMERAMGETSRRRAVQLAYNKKHKITPLSIQKTIVDITQGMESAHAKAVNAELALDMELFAAVAAADAANKKGGKGCKGSGRGKKNPIEKLIAIKESEMKESVKVLDFETAAILRDEIKVLKDKTYIS